MLRRWADVVFAHRRRLALLLAVLFLAAAAGGAGVFAVLDDGGGDVLDQSAQSWDARVENASAGGPALRADALVRVADPADAARVARLARDTPGIDAAYGPGDLATVIVRGPADGRLLQAPGGPAYVVAYYGAGDDEATTAALRAALRPVPGVVVGGDTLAGDERDATIGPDLGRAEALAFPILFLLSLWVFRGVVAALLPLVAGVVTIMVAFLGLRVAAELTTLSQYTLNVVTGVGLGLSIDYALILVWRYREEVLEQGHGRAALGATLATAGRTVLFSAVTVAACSGALVVMPLGFLVSMGLGAAFAALAAALVAITVIPVLIALLGPRIDAWAPARWRRAAERTASPSTHGPWYRIAWAAMRRPWLTAILTTALLVVLAIPAARLHLQPLGPADAPSDTRTADPARTAAGDLPAAVTQPVVVLRRGAVGAADLDRLAALPGVVAVTRPLALEGGMTRVDLIPDGEPSSAAARRLVEDVRALPGDQRVGGTAADFVDQEDAVRGALVPAAAIAVGALLIILFLLTGSVVLPIKALVMTTLSAGAALGLCVLIFQDGHLEGLLGFTSTDGFDLTTPVIILTLAFGLSTDYGVFLLTRIREARDQGADEREAIALGLDRTGRIVTAAALLFCIAMGAFVTARVTLIKEIGVGTALAVLIDATIVRGLLVPSLMALLGPRNWWAPAPLRRLHVRLGLQE